MCDKPENCAICKDKFDELLRRPRILPCGHTICSQCAKATVLKGLFFCPGCHPERSVAADAQLPVNGAEALITTQTDIRPTSVASESLEPQDSSVKAYKILRLLVEQQKRRLNTFIIRCNRPLLNLGKHYVLLREWTIKHHRLEEGLYSLLEQNNAALRLLERELRRVAALSAVGQDIRRHLQELVVRLDTENAAQEVYVIIKDIDKRVASLKKWLRKCQDICKNSHTVVTSIMMLEKMKASMKATSEKQAAVSPVNLADTTVSPVNLADTPVSPVNLADTPVSPDNLDDSSSSSESEVQSVDDDFFDMLLIFSVEYLRNTSRPIQNLFLSGWVFSIEEFHGGFYSARMTLRGEEMYFHDLEKKPPTGCPTTFKDGAMLQLLDHCSTRALDFIGRNRATVEQVEICISPDPALSKQFVSLHTGDIRQAEDSEEHGVYVVVGEYNRLSNEDTHDPRPTVEGQYEGPGTEWDINAWVHPDTGNWVQFGIMLDSFTIPDNSSADVLGGAEGDQDALMAAAQATDFPQTVELDCGIVLPF